MSNNNCTVLVSKTCGERAVEEKEKKEKKRCLHQHTSKLNLIFEMMVKFKEMIKKPQRRKCQSQKITHLSSCSGVSHSQVLKKIKNPQFEKHCKRC
jgi:hypothetical protein